MEYLPLFCQLRDRSCLLVGAGDVAERKARLLLAAGARLTVCALTFNAAFYDWQNVGQLTLRQQPFTAELLTGCWLVIAATGDNEVNQQVSAAAEARQLFCNVVDTPDLASVIIPSVIDRSPLMVAVSSGGRAPVLARLLREKLEAILPQHLGQLASLAGKLRARVKQHFPAAAQRRRFWEKLFAHHRLAQSLANNDAGQTTALTETLFSEPPDHRGEVVLVGAGPGDVGLLTLKGLQQLQQADVVVYDRLISEDVINLVRRDAERIFVGKQSGYHSVPQEEINRILCQQAQAGKRVVRLKGGDSFIFGRGAEELEALQAAGIPFSVVPGITAASGCAAYSGIPLTHRHYTQSVCFVTGHRQHNQSPDWATLAAEKQTLVFYMGLTQAAEIEHQLMAHGMASTMPVALIENGTSTRQRVICGELQQLGMLAQQVASPTLIIVGEVVRLHDRLQWFHTAAPKM